MQRIYDSEIHIKIGWFWDGGVDYVVGTDTPDFWVAPVKLTRTDERDMGMAFAIMCIDLVYGYPESSFTKWFCKKFKFTPEAT